MDIGHNMEREDWKCVIGEEIARLIRTSQVRRVNCGKVFPLYIGDRLVVVKIKNK